MFLQGAGFREFVVLEVLLGVEARGADSTEADLKGLGLLAGVGELIEGLRGLVFVFGG